VAVIIPARNESAHLERTLESVLAQRYEGTVEVCIALAPSVDDTAQIASRIAAGDPRVRVVDNPAGTTPAGLNAAIGATAGEIVVRVDAHAELPADYVRTAVEVLVTTGAVNVGGVQRAEGTTPFEIAAATAMRSWFGTGGSRFHLGGRAGEVDTVYLGVFDRRALEAVGGFDESLLRNQDYELNIRLRRAGGVIWFDPRLEVGYQPRATLRALARQYHEYGRWKLRVARLHPGSLRPRQIAPVVVTVALLASAVISPWRRIAGLPILGYLGIDAAVSMRSAGSARQRLWLLAIYPTMHLAWGLGFCRGLLADARLDLGSMTEPGSRTSGGER